MAYDERLATRVRSVISGTAGVAETKMFGGLCFTVNGYMACGVQDSDLMVRVGAENYADALYRAHVRQMDFTGRPLKGYVYVAEAGHRRRDQLKRWVGLAVAFVETLPPKEKKRKARR